MPAVIVNSFTFFSDPGHAWLCVPKAFLPLVGLTVESFSEYSYRDGNHVYLEEEVDAAKFLGMYKKKYGGFPELPERHTDDECFVRHLPSLK